MIIIIIITFINPTIIAIKYSYIKKNKVGCNEHSNLWHIYYSLS